MKKMLETWFERKSIILESGAIVVEPTALQFARLKSAIDTNNNSDIVLIINELSPGVSAEDLEPAIVAIGALAKETPIKEPEHDGDSTLIDWDISLLIKSDRLAKRYSVMPDDIIARYTMRQMDYLLWLDYNSEMRDWCAKAALAGVSMKEKPKPLRLARPDGLGTEGMTIREKAEYFKRKK